MINLGQILQKEYMDHPILQLDWQGYISPTMKCLDVGTRDGQHAAALQKMGCRVRAIDIRPSPKPIAGVTIERADIETFMPGEKFDLVLARNVLPFTSDPLAVLKRLTTFLAPVGILYFTTFGREASYVKRGIAKALTPGEVGHLFHDNFDIRSSNTFLEWGPSRTNHTLEFWHIYQMTVKKVF
jgi:2-polyprenyl-3-methyl-5-hydroxy-6-metoxy-1,4-benzoquinol methylase